MNEQQPNQEQKPKKKDKKWLWIIGGIFLLVIIIAIASSGGKNEQPNTTNSTTTEKTQNSNTKSETVYSVNQDVKVGDVRWKITSAKDKDSVLKGSESRYAPYAKDKTTTGKFVEIIVEVENLGKEMKSYSDVKIVDDKNREFTYATDVLEWIPEDKQMIILGNLNPNVPQQFMQIYEIPSDATGLKVKVGDLDLFKNKEALISLGI